MDGQRPVELDGDEIIARAADIATRLTARGAAAEKAGRLPQETIDEVVKAGIMRLSVPKRYGGLELPYPVVPQVSRMLGRGCLATSWVVGILVGHNFQMGFWPERAQDEFWASGPSKFAPGFIVPGGTARKVDGGYRLTGHWRMGSGYPHGDWILLGAFEALVDGKKGPLLRFALPVADTTPQNNWNVSGLAATGTWDCRLDDVFVPEHRHFPAAMLLDATAPGSAINTGPLWRIPLISYYYPNLSAMMLGAAEGVAALVTEKMKQSSALLRRRARGRDRHDPGAYRCRACQAQRGCSSARERDQSDLAHGARWRTVHSRGARWRSRELHVDRQAVARGRERADRVLRHRFVPNGQPIAALPSRDQRAREPRLLRCRPHERGLWTGAARAAASIGRVGLGTQGDECGMLRVAITGCATGIGAASARILRSGRLRNVRRAWI